MQRTADIHPEISIEQPAVERHYRLLLLVVLALAGVCRIAQYVADRSFWHDEASLVLNIRNKTAGELLGRLDYEQAAPPLFLLAQRGLYRLMGGSEMALRSLPLICGLLSVVLIAAIARRVVGKPWDLLAIFLFGVSDMLIWHATEVKQYGTDVFTAILLTWLALRDFSRDDVADDGDYRISQYVVFLGVSMIAVWFSYPAVFVFGSLMLALLPKLARHGVKGWLVLFVGSGLVGASFIAVFLICVRRQQDATLVSYWLDDFVDWQHPMGVPKWLLDRLLALCDYPLRAAGPVMLLGAAAGMFALIRSKRFLLLGILWLALLTIASAAAHRYPFDGARLTAFLTPDIILLAVIGFQWVYRAHFVRAGWLTLVPAGFVAVVALYWAGAKLIVPRTRGNLRPVAEYVGKHILPDDGLYALEEREWICYWPAADPRMRRRLDSAERIPFRRFWVIWSFSSDHGLHRVDPQLRWLEEFAARRDTFINRAGGAAFLFERTPGAMPKDLSVPNIDTHHKMMRSKKDSGPGMQDGGEDEP